MEEGWGILSGGNIHFAVDLEIAVGDKFTETSSTEMHFNV